MNKFFYLLFISFLWSCGSSKEIKEVPKVKVNYNKSDELTKVLEKAKKEKKIVFLDMYTDWCLPCKVMDEEVFNNKEVADFLNKNFINYKVNGEKLEGPDLTLIFSVEAYPTLLFLDSRGRVLDRQVGGVGIDQFMVKAEQVLETYEQRR